MDRLHQSRKGAEGQSRDPGKGCLQYHREGTELERDHAAQDRGRHQTPPHTVNGLFRL